MLIIEKEYCTGVELLSLLSDIKKELSKIEVSLSAIERKK
jgi:hypothetical protein